MRGNYWVFIAIGYFCLVSAFPVRSEQDHAVSSGSTVIPIVASDESGQAAQAALLDPTIITPSVTVVPEPSTIAMLMLGAGLTSSLLAIRRHNRRS